MWGRVLTTFLLCFATETVHGLTWGSGLELADASQLEVLIEGISEDEDAEKIGLTENRVLQKAVKDDADKDEWLQLPHNDISKGAGGRR